MTRLNWDAVGERFYETGVDRGVLYAPFINGVAWMGLISVSESPTGGEAKPYYLDGIKYLNLSAAEEFEATLVSFYYPPEFNVCDGVATVHTGLFATQQKRQSFGFSYRTRLGNDLKGSEYGYKIHLVYNALANPASRDNNTMSDEVEPSNYSWHITTLPPALTGLKPTAHLVIDSSLTPKNLLSTVEDMIYGSEVDQPRLPPAQELVDLFKTEGPLLRQNFITDPKFITASGWTGVGAGGVVTTGATQIYSPNKTAAIGEIWTVGIDITAPSGTTLTGKVITGATTDGLFGSAAIGETVFSIPAGTKKRVYNTFTLLTPANGLRLLIVFDVAVPAGVIIGNAQMEKSNLKLSYFDGSTPDANGNYYSWEGAVNGSISDLHSWN